MYIVTGGAGFIGSNLVKALNDRGETDILVIDDLTEGGKFANLADCRFADYLDVDAFRALLRDGGELGKIEGVFHQGACSDTTATDGKYVLDLNYECSKEVFRWCQSRLIPMVFASSAAVYGGAAEFREFAGHERPLNVYGWSKWLFDRWLSDRMQEVVSPAVGLRYFNVYGPREAHKDRMASVVHHFSSQIRQTGRARLFEGSHGYGDGEQLRDFVFVGDVVAVNMWAMEGTAGSGIFNVGTGTARSFNDVARSVIDWHGKGEIEYIPFPGDLAAAYQPFTEANVERLRQAGYRNDFTPIETGIRMTLDAVAQRAA